MNKFEKILLIDLILRDIRNDWKLKVWTRCIHARNLAEELELVDHVNRINRFFKIKNRDGRHFRTHYDNGGYLRLKELHGLKRTICDKSKEFQEESEILNYPEEIFKDYDKYIEGVKDERKKI